MRLTGVLPSAVPRASVSGTVMSPSMTATNIICSHQPSRHNGRISSGKRQWEPDSILQERAMVAPRIDGGGKGRVTSEWSRVRGRAVGWDYRRRRRRRFLAARLKRGCTHGNVTRRDAFGPPSGARCRDFALLNSWRETPGTCKYSLAESETARFGVMLAYDGRAKFNQAPRIARAESREAVLESRERFQLPASCSLVARCDPAKQW